MNPAEPVAPLDPRPAPRSARVWGPALLFTALSLLITWGAGEIVIATTRRVLPVAVLFLLVARFGPTLAGLIMIAATEGEAGLSRIRTSLFRWRIGVRWYAVILVGVPVSIWGVALLHLGATSSQDLRWVLDLAPSVFFFLLLLARHTIFGGGLGEEIGWRGYLLPLLLKRTSPVAASVMIGAIWGLWHIPQITAPGTWPESSRGEVLLLYIALGIPVSILFTWVLAASRGSLFLIVLLHACINASSRVASEVSDKIAKLTGAPIDPGLGTEWMGVALAWVLALLAIRHTRGTLGVNREIYGIRPPDRDLTLTEPGGDRNSVGAGSPKPEMGQTSPDPR